MPTDDGEHQRQAVTGGPDHRLRAAADTHPRREASRWERRTYVLIVEWRSSGSGPGHGLIAEQAREQVELLFEERLVVGEVESKQREGVRQRPAADDQLCTAIRYRVEGRELGVHPYRILRTEHRHGGAEPDAFGSTGDRREHHMTCRVHELGAVVLADVEGVEADGFCENGFLDGVADDLVAVEQVPGLVDTHLSGCVQAELEYACGHSSARFAALGPASEEFDLRFGPCSVARHRAGLEAGEDGVGVLADVVV